MRKPLVLVTALALAATAALADPPEGKGKGKHKKGESTESATASTTSLVVAGVTAAIARHAGSSGSTVPARRRSRGSMRLIRA